MSGVVVWSAEADDVIRGDLTAAVAYATPAGGAVVTSVTTLGLGSREAGVVTFTTSLGLSKKLERILRDPRVAIAFHTRDHGFSTSPLYVMAQGDATVDLTPSEDRLEAIIPNAEKFLGGVKRGRLWDRLLREYYFERVFVDVGLVRLLQWPTTAASGQPEVGGQQLPAPPPPQSAPSKGAAPRVKMEKVARQVAKLPHRLLAYIGGDGYPVIVPVRIDGYDAEGFRLTTDATGIPAGGRRAGLLAHGYRANLIGLGTRGMTGWLEVTDDGTMVYAPHTAKGWSVPPMKRLLLVMNGLLAKFGYTRAVRKGVLDDLRRLQAASPDGGVEPNS